MNLAIIYYSSTGATYKMAEAVQEGARSVGAQTRLRKARELAPDEVIDAKPAWRAHIEATRDVPVAELADLEWADGFVFGTPTRFGLPAAQIKQFLDQTGPLWAQGKLQDKAAGMFAGAGNPHGGQEATLLAVANVFYHWGALIVPPGYTDPAFGAAGGNPYGVSYTDPRGSDFGQETLQAARMLGARVARFAEALAPLRT